MQHAVHTNNERMAVWSVCGTKLVLYKEIPCILAGVLKLIGFIENTKINII